MVFLEKSSSDAAVLRQGPLAAEQSTSLCFPTRAGLLAFELRNDWATRPPTREMSEAKHPTEPRPGSPDSSPGHSQPHWVWVPLAFTPAGRTL